MGSSGPALTFGNSTEHHLTVRLYQNLALQGCGHNSKEETPYLLLMLVQENDEKRNRYDPCCADRGMIARRMKRQVERDNGRTVIVEVV